METRKARLFVSVRGPLLAELLGIPAAYKRQLACCLRAHRGVRCVRGQRGAYRMLAISREPSAERALRHLGRNGNRADGPMRGDEAASQATDKSALDFCGNGARQPCLEQSCH